MRGILRGGPRVFSRGRGWRGEGRGSGARRGTPRQSSFKITYNSSRFYVILRGMVRGGILTARGGKGATYVGRGKGGLSGKHIETTIYIYIYILPVLGRIADEKFFPLKLFLRILHYILNYPEFFQILFPIIFGATNHQSSTFHEFSWFLSIFKLILLIIVAFSKKITRGLFCHKILYFGKSRWRRSSDTLSLWWDHLNVKNWVFISSAHRLSSTKNQEWKIARICTNIILTLLE